MATATETTLPRFVATIDFGTTHCSVAYLIRPDLQPEPSKLEPIVLSLDNDENKRVSSYILFDSNRKMIAFGQEARDKYASLKREERPKYHYFEHVKKQLQREKVTYIIFIYTASLSHYDFEARLSSQV